MANKSTTRKPQTKGDDELVFETRSSRRKKQVPITVDGETFMGRPSLAGPVIYEHTKLLRVASMMEPGAEANAAAADALLGFFLLVLGKEEYARFWEFCTTHEVEWELLGEIHRKLLVRYSKRPTGPSSG